MLLIIIESCSLSLSGYRVGQVMIYDTISDLKERKSNWEILTYRESYMTRDWGFTQWLRRWKLSHRGINVANCASVTQRLSW